MWDCHEHRDELWISNSCTVYHKEHGQLCWWEVHWDCIIYHPIQFKDKTAAAKWIGEGCIADIQEGLSRLQVGFSCEGFSKREYYRG
jgi:hypothetical protein